MIGGNGRNRDTFAEAVLGQKEAVTHYPQKIFLESTTRCNFRCTMCPLYGDTSSGTDFDKDLFDRKVVPLLRYAKEIALQGIGEPLLSKNFDHFYRTAIEHGVRPIFITNGSQLDEEKIRRFVKDGVTMRISIDGITKETLSRFRPEAKIDQLFETLYLVGQISREYPESGFELSLSSILSTFNVHEFAKLIDYGREWNARVIIIYELLLLENAPESIRNGVLQQEDIERHSNLLESGKRKAKEYGIELLLPAKFGGTISSYVLPDRFKSLAEVKSRSGNHFPGVCLAPWKDVTIDANGDVRPCCVSPDVLGNLYKDDFESIWNGEKLKYYRKTVNSLSPPKICRICSNPTGINIGSPNHQC